MPDFTKMPEALDFVAGQSWLSPVEPVRAAPSRTGSATKTVGTIGLGAGLREIAGIVRRIALR